MSHLPDWLVTLFFGTILLFLENCLLLPVDLTNGHMIMWIALCLGLGLGIVTLFCLMAIWPLIPKGDQ